MRDPGVLKESAEDIWRLPPCTNGVREVAHWQLGLVFLLVVSSRGCCCLFLAGVRSEYLLLKYLPIVFTVLTLSVNTIANQVVFVLTCGLFGL